VYTACEAGKRRTVNHTRARSLASPSRAVAEAEAEAEARRGAAGRTSGAVRCGARPAGRDVPVRCGAMTGH
jgi:hypothetical protein